MEYDNGFGKLTREEAELLMRTPESPLEMPIDEIADLAHRALADTLRSNFNRPIPEGARGYGRYRALQTLREEAVVAQMGHQLGE